MSMNVPIGPNEVRITRVWTVEAANEFGIEHDPTPNMRELGAGTAAAGSFNLRIEVEAGALIGAAAGTYDLIIRAACLTNPLATIFANLDRRPGVPPGQIPENFVGATRWEFQAARERYTRSWSISFPTAPLFSGGPWFLNQRGQTWQFFVTLVSTAATPTFVCTAASEPFLLV